MRIVRPTTVDNTNLTASNVPEAPPAAYSGATTYGDGDTAAELQADGFTWKVYESLQPGNMGNALSDTDWWLLLGETYGEYDGGTTYDVDDIVISTTDNHAYQALVDGESGNSLSNTAKWLDLGPTNRYKMFDRSNTSQTVNGESIDVTIDVSGVCNSVSFLNLTAATIQLIMSTATDGEIYNETVSLVSSGGVSNWWEYFFEPVTRFGDYTFDDLPTNLDPTVRAIVTDPGATAKCGSMVVGLSRYFGETLYPSNIGIQDYSRKETDEFGYYTIVERNFAKRAALKVSCEEAKVDPLTTVLADLRATAVVFIGVEAYRATWIYGFIKNWDWQFAGPNQAILNLEIEGLT